jgi:hypothetical protein
MFWTSLCYRYKSIKDKNVIPNTVLHSTTETFMWSMAEVRGQQIYVEPVTH